MTSHGMLTRSIRTFDQPLKYKRVERTPRSQTIYHTVNGDKLRKSIRTYDAADPSDMEPWCEMFIDFSTTMSDWEVTTGPPKFQFYKEYLEGQARNIWDQERARATGTSVVQFNQCVERFVTRIVGPRPRDTCSRYLNSESAVSKPYATDVYTHASRLETLFTYHDLLPGNVPKLMTNTEEAIIKRKTILFKSFPHEWQIEYNNKNPQGIEDPDVSWHDIVEFMRGHRKYIHARKQAEEQRASRRQARSDGNRNPRSHGNRNRNFQFHRNQASHRPYPSYQGNWNNFQRPSNFQGQRGQNNYNPNFQPRGQGGQFQPRRGYGQRNQGQRNFGNQNFRNANQQRQSNSSQQHYLQDVNVSSQAEAEAFMMMNENNTEYENNGDTVDQSWSSPDGTYPDGNAESGAELHNYEMNYPDNQMYFSNNNIDQQNEQSEYNEDTHGPCNFDDAYYYDHDYNY